MVTLYFYSTVLVYGHAPTALAAAQLSSLLHIVLSVQIMYYMYLQLDFVLRVREY